MGETFKTPWVESGRTLRRVLRCSEAVGEAENIASDEHESSSAEKLGQSVDINGR